MVVSIKAFVIDASFVLSSLLPDEESPEADKLLKKFVIGEIDLVSTNVFELEVFNGFRSAILQKRVSSENVLAIAERFLKLGISCENIDSYGAFLISQKENLSVYDASYVWLARSKNFPLLTLDAKLRRILSEHRRN
ncbi:type II toxin-antitoxin system VapC family toxin [Candidatus Curtissbacteria bacterium]|nr:type II toxin-antitoxin system VapC family toxin [Candidatus Curtissbacteria bacterium]